MKISYAITVYNELDEIIRLISFLQKAKQAEDEIVVLFDDKGPEQVWNYLKSQEEHIVLHPANFKNNFADWKNKLGKLCSGDFIFQIDADEIPHEDLIKILPTMLEENSEVDMFLVPRVNTVEGITEEHIQKWGWRVNSDGWVNYPDYQTRIYRNSPDIKWVGNVHERINGTKTFSPLPADEWWSLYHPKTIERQEKQNNYYETL